MRKAPSLSAREGFCRPARSHRKVRLPWHPRTSLACAVSSASYISSSVASELPQLKFSRMVPLKRTAFCRTTPATFALSSSNRIIPHILPVDENLSSGRIVKPRNQIHDRRFFPEPVPPIIPMVSPRLTGKNQCRRALLPMRPHK